MRVIDCSGDGRTRGRIHGEEARPQVRAALDAWSEAVRQSSGRRPVDYAASLVESTGLIRGVAARCPDLRREIAGIAEGAGVDLTLLEAYNLMDEQWWYDRRSSPAAGSAGCSVIARQAKDGVFLAQTMDLPAFMSGSQLVLRISGPQQPEALVLTSAGMIGLCGVNAAGVGLAVNTLLALEHSNGGLPVSALARGALRRQSDEDALAFLASAPHASGQHYAVASAAGVRALEGSGAATVRVPVGGGTYCHTNHALANPSVDERSQSALVEIGQVRDSMARLDFLNREAPAVVTIDDVKAVLADESVPISVVPRENSPICTFAAVAFAFGKGAPLVEMCEGLPSESAWESFRWSTSNEGGALSSPKWQLA
jgi:hypothetical protein